MVGGTQHKHFVLHYCILYCISTADSVAVPSVQVFRQDSNVSEGGGGAAGEWTYPSNTYLCSQTYAHQKICIQENLKKLDCNAFTVWLVWYGMGGFYIN